MFPHGGSLPLSGIFCEIQSQLLDLTITTGNLKGFPPHADALDLVLRLTLTVFGDKRWSVVSGLTLTLARTTMDPVPSAKRLRVRRRWSHSNGQREVSIVITKTDKNILGQLDTDYIDLAQRSSKGSPPRI